MAEQMLGYGQLDERYLTAMNVMTARREVATTLISNSGYLLRVTSISPCLKSLSMKPNTFQHDDKFQL